MSQGRLASAKAVVSSETHQWDSQALGHSKEETLSTGRTEMAIGRKEASLAVPDSIEVTNWKPTAMATFSSPTR